MVGVMSAVIYRHMKEDYIAKLMVCVMSAVIYRHMKEITSPN